MGRKFQKKKNKSSELEIVPMDENPPLPAERTSEDVVPKREKWINKQRVLVFSARGINHRDRHLMRDIRTLMPHHRPEAKMERSKTLSVINEMCEMKHCNKCILFEGRRKRDLYMWITNMRAGPSAKFLVENIHTMAELKMTGNCLRGSRPLLSFDAKFDEIPYLKLLKELLKQTFAVPNHHPKSQPFIDHIFTFTYLDSRIWFRNFQILSEDGGLAEIGPRFVLNPVKIFSGSFSGQTIWENPNYVSPARQRQMLKKVASDKYINRIEQKATQEATKPKHAYEGLEYEELFEDGNAVETAKLLNEKAKKKIETAKVNLEANEKKKSVKSNLMERIKEKQLKAAINIIKKKKALNTKKEAKTESETTEANGELNAIKQQNGKNKPTKNVTENGFKISKNNKPKNITKLKENDGGLTKKKTEIKNKQIKNDKVGKKETKSINNNKINKQQKNSKLIKAVVESPEKSAAVKKAIVGNHSTKLIKKPIKTKEKPKLLKKATK